MSTHFLMAIDQGTTGTTVLLLSSEGVLLAKANTEFKQYFPKDGWVEHEPEEIWQSFLESVRKVFESSGLKTEDCLGIGITNQRETSVVWDRNTGRSPYKAIVWQDRRTANRCEELRSQGYEDLVREKTGLLLDPYFSATKLEWMLSEVSEIRVGAEQGKMVFGTIDSWLLFRLTGGRVHATDASNASRTLLFNLRTGDWDEELLSIFNIPKVMLPEVKSCSEVYGETRDVPGLPDGIPVAGMAGDQQAALFGQNCFERAQGKCTYGTGAFLLMNTGSEFVVPHKGLISTVAWRLGEETTYALEGSVFIAGAAVQWLRDGLRIIKTAEEVEALASEVESSDPVVFVPALTGLGAPHWNPHARGLIIGIGRNTTMQHLARATLEGIALQVGDLLNLIEENMGHRMATLRVDGGACKNNLMMQFQSDMIEIPVERPAYEETTALGAAYLAGLCLGVFRDLDHVRKVNQMEQIFFPKMDADRRKKHRQSWKHALLLANLQVEAK